MMSTLFATPPARPGRPLPGTEGRAPSDAAPRAQPERTTRPAAPADPRVVLVVDDAPDTLRMLCTALAQAGYTVLVARDGHEALARFELAVPDAVLMDAVMPGMGGFEACRALKAQPGWAHVPVIFMTGLAETEQIVEGFDAGGVDYVVKPLKVDEVLARLNTHLRNARVTRLAREAVDVGGLGVVLLDAHGRVAWCSPQSQQWLGEAFGAPVDDHAAILWLSQAAEVPQQRAIGAAHRLCAWAIGRVGLDETMLLLRREAADAGGQRLASAQLTPRETEVLSWLAKGKTNRDIGDILGMSPRTVNKHLEHIFEKLGVETRSAAAALASRMLPGEP